MIRIFMLILLAGCQPQMPVHAPCGHMAFVRSSGGSDAHRMVCAGQWVAIPTGPWYRCECPPEEGGE